MREASYLVLTSILSEHLYLYGFQMCFQFHRATQHDVLKCYQANTGTFDHLLQKVCSHICP